jgi:hypothetical protein
MTREGVRTCARAIADLLGSSGGEQAPQLTEQVLELLRDEPPEVDYEFTPEGGEGLESGEVLESGEILFGAPKTGWPISGRSPIQAPMQLYTAEP